MLGIDLGTSQVKALVAAADGTVLGRGRAGYEISVPAGGYAESDPAEWWRATRAAVGEATAAAGRAEVEAIAVTGQMHGMVLAGAEGEPVRDAIVWLDRRAAAEADSYRRLPPQLTEVLGNAPSPGMAGPIFRWLATHEPDVVNRARWALQPKDWVRLRLTGQAATDPTDASGTLLFDLAADDWASGVIDALGLPAGKLPPVRRSRDVAGPLLAGPADDLGLRPGIPVAVGASDTAASLHAAAPGEGAALLTLGTGGQLAALTRDTRPVPGLHLFAAADGGRYHLAATQNAGEVLRWVTRIHGVSFGDLYSVAAGQWRPDTPVFLPYLTEERWDAPAGGTWAGFTLGHSRDDLLRAALEGVAFLLRDRLEDLRAAGHDPRTVLAGGGGLRDPGWRQLIADVLGLPLRPVPESSWLSVMGAAMLAQEAAGITLLAREAAGITLAQEGEGITGATGPWLKNRAADNKADTTDPRHIAAARGGYERWVAHKRAMLRIGVRDS